MRALWKPLLAGWRLRWALWQLVQREIAARSRGSILGFGWLLLEPLFLFALYTWVFGHLFKVRFGPAEGLGQFAMYLWCGLIPYNCLQEAVLGSAEVLPANRPLLLHTRFPGWMLPLGKVLESGVSEILGLGVLLVAVGYEYGLGWWGFLLPLLMFVRFLLTLGLAWMSSILFVFVPDFLPFLRMLLTLGFFATPIIYPPGLIPANWHWVLSCNPFYWLVAGYRSILLEGVMPPSGFWWMALGSLLGATLAWVFFNQAVSRAKDFL